MDNKIQYPGELYGSQVQCNSSGSNNSESTWSSLELVCYSVIGTMVFVGALCVSYKYGQKNGHEKAENEYNCRLKETLDRANRVLAKKESQK